MMSPQVKRLRRAVRECDIRTVGGVRTETFRLTDPATGYRYREYGRAQTLTRVLEPSQREALQQAGVTLRPICGGSYWLLEA